MVSMEVHGGPAPHGVLRDAVDWGRVVVGTLARGVVATLLGLALWAAAPALIGWQPTTVMTGSMEPRLAPGDVVVSRPVAPSDLRVGKILLADDPDQPGHLRMHRYVEDGPDGTLVTKGDANPQQDSTPLERSAVHGVAFLRIPVVGAPVLWARTGEWLEVGMLALALVGVLALCTVDGSLRRYVSGDGDEGDESGPSASSGTAGDGQEARSGPATSLPAGSRSRVHGLHRADRRPHGHRLVAGALAVLVGTGLGVLQPTAAVAAPFGATTSTSAAFSALTLPQATALTCTANADGSVSIGFAYGNVAALPATSFTVVSGTTELATGTTSPVRVTGSGLLNLGRTYTVAVRANSGTTWTSTSTATTRVQTALAGTTLSCG
jgi:signal peptidase I